MACTMTNISILDWMNNVVIWSRFSFIFINFKHLELKFYKDQNYTLTRWTLCHIYFRYIISQCNIYKLSLQVEHSVRKFHGRWHWHLLFRRTSNTYQLNYLALSCSLTRLNHVVFLFKISTSFFIIGRSVPYRIQYRRFPFNYLVVGL